MKSFLIKVIKKIINFLLPIIILGAVLGFFYIKDNGLYRKSYKAVAYKPVKKIPLTVYVDFSPDFKSHVYRKATHLKYSSEYAVSKGKRGRRRRDAKKNSFDINIDVPIGEMEGAFFTKNLKEIFRKVYFIDKAKLPTPKNGLRLRVFTPEITFERTYWDDPIAAYVEYAYEMTTFDGKFLFYFTAEGFGSEALHEHLGYLSQGKYYKKAAQTAMIDSYNKFVLYIQDSSTKEKLFSERIITK